MIRGCERRIYHVKNPESEIFDEAYFILRRGYDPAASGGRRIALDEEVRRLVSGAGVPERSRRRGIGGRLAAFIAGASASAALAAIVFLLCR